MIWLICLGCLASSVCLVSGVTNLVISSGDRRRQVSSVVEDDLVGSRFARWDKTFRTTRLGSRLQKEVVLAGINRSPLAVFGAALGGGLTAAYLLWNALAPVFAVAGLLAGFMGVRTYLARGRSRRLEAFIAQMPQLARVLANSLDAGRSITSAVGLAAEAMEEPARTEMQRVATRLQFDASVDGALSEIQDRLASREVAVMVSTLIISARSGGSLVSSLRDVAVTLEDRKEVRREVRTTLAQALFTGYVVVGMGFGLLFMLNTIAPGTVEKMTTTLLGQGALLVSLGLFTSGLLVIRRMTRIEP